jgi:N utilization substance protein B
MQALYAYYQGENKDIARCIQEMMQGTSKIYELYLHILLFYPALANEERVYYEDTPESLITGKKKTAERKLSDLPFIQWLESDKSFAQAVKAAKLNWQADVDAIRKAFYQLRQKDEYKDFITLKEKGGSSDSKLLRFILKENFETTDLIKHLLEEKNLYWAEGIEMALQMVQKTIDSQPGFGLMPLYKDEEDDTRFMKDLFEKTIRDDSYFHQLISEKTRNWDADRIALVDIILMKMALCEILHLPTVPVKVSINEYIDISKDYSTPNSKAFINGVIDKLVIELRNEGRIVKTGRGLVE